MSARWRYSDGLDGGALVPSHWGDFPAWYTCAHGSAQSPIDISMHNVPVCDMETTDDEHIDGCRMTVEACANEVEEWTHPRVPTSQLTNTGHTAQLTFKSGNRTLLIQQGMSSQKYVFVQAHWHTPSEHTVEGRHYAMEMHVLHKSTTQPHRLLVVAIFFQQSQREMSARKPRYASSSEDWQHCHHTGCNNSPAASQHTNENAFLKTVGFDHIPPTVSGQHDIYHHVELRELLPNDVSFWTYKGSLTTPPCTEGVTWMVLQQPVALTAGQLHSFRTVFGGNARPVQPLHHRRVFSRQNAALSSWSAMDASESDLLLSPRQSDAYLFVMVLALLLTVVRKHCLVSENARSSLGISPSPPLLPTIHQRSLYGTV